MHGAIRDDHSGPILQDTVHSASRRGAAAAGDDLAAIAEALAEKIGQQKYRIWFKNSTRFTLAGGYLKIGVPNLFMASWLENHFLTDITRAATAVLGASPMITFVVDPELTADHRRIRIDWSGQEAEPSKGQPPAKNQLQEQQSSRAIVPQQTDRKLKLSLDTFVVGPSNELAYNAAKAVIRERQSPFNPLFIHGGYGVGKTHLLQGICNEVSRCRPETNWLYLSAEDFANHFVLALKTKKLEAFRRRMRQTDLLAIDDIHFLASKPSTQEEFLHTFNTINLAGKQVVLVSDAHPKMISQLSEKLVNRFVSGMVVKIEPPDFEMRCEICRRYAKTVTASAFGEPKAGARASKSLNHIPEDATRFIAEKLRTNVRELEGAVLKLIAYSALQNEQITLPMAEAVLAEHLERCDPIVHVCDIETVVAAYFGTTPAAIASTKKDRTVSLARHFSMYLTRKHTKMSSAEIGRIIGNKNHATVLMGCKKVDEMVERNADVQWQGPTGNRVVKAKTILAHLEDNIMG